MSGGERHMNGKLKKENIAGVQDKACGLEQIGAGFNCPRIHTIAYSSMLRYPFLIPLDMFVISVMLMRLCNGTRLFIQLMPVALVGRSIIW